MRNVGKFIRIGIIAIGAVLELLIVFVIYHFFSGTFVYIESVLRIFGILAAIWIINNSRHLSSDMLWILLLILLPVPGLLIYLLLGANLTGSKTYRNIRQESALAGKYLKQDESVLSSLQEEYPALKGDAHYLAENAGYPFYRNTGFDYYGLGDEGYPVMLEELRKAEKFIFMEYFIIEKGIMWDGMLEILKEKAAQGLDVRVMYDDMGSLFKLPTAYQAELEKAGIKCVCFNRLNPVFGAVMNHRDHRKILVIDGKTAFSGGINLADEYINRKVVFGHWKDNCIRIQGEAVWSYTVLFLTNWNAQRKTDSDYTVFRAEQGQQEHDGFICPYGVTPFSQERVGQDVYMNILSGARKYVYIFTPYLIIDTELENALILAARKGVDVRIITPGIPDKKVVWWITKSFYGNLIAGGVKVFEYTPGFNHAKVFVSDDTVAAVGTINLDYRSLYLHFENGTYLCGSEKIAGIRDDFLKTCDMSREIREEDLHRNIFFRLFVDFVKLFASQM